MLISVLLAFFTSSCFAKTLPESVLGFYCLLADDTETGYTSSAVWQPSLYDYILNGSNVIWLSFINPTTMDLPPAFANLAKCRGTDQEGCPRDDQIIIASVGGSAYSERIQRWPWLATQNLAENMAINISKWDTMFGIDGIDLDIESPDGDQPNYAQNLVYFARKLKELNPDFIITQPVYGSPQVLAENNMVNNGWDSDGNPTGLVETIGIMVYENTRSLLYVDNYADGPSQGNGINVPVPREDIIVGIQGGTAQAVDMANECVEEKVRGMMVWYTSVYDATNDKAAFCYGDRDNAFQNTDGYQDWSEALEILTQ